MEDAQEVNRAVKATYNLIRKACINWHNNITITGMRRYCSNYANHNHYKTIELIINESNSTQLPTPPDEIRPALTKAHYTRQAGISVG